jgi:hypothetical protein
MKQIKHIHMKNNFIYESIYYFPQKLKRIFYMLELDYNKNSVLSDKCQRKRNDFFFMFLNISLKSIFIIRR